jgi:uncharacterized protein YdaU (DUF1376 family)
VNYYEHHIGDYEAATAHLSLEEDAIYSRMLRRYYMQEGPLPAEFEKVARLIRARDQVEIVKAMLLEFFTLADDGWHHKRCDEEISRYRVKAQKRRDAANTRWGGESVKQECNSNANAMHAVSAVHDVCNASQAPSTRHQTPEEAKAPVPDGDAAVILAAYHDLLPACQQVSVLGPKRKRLIATAVKHARQVCREQGWPYAAEEFWRAYFTECAADAWLRGDKPNPNNPAWKQKLDTLLDETRFTAVMDKAIAAMRRDA